MRAITSVRTRKRLLAYAASGYAVVTFGRDAFDNFERLRRWGSGPAPILNIAAGFIGDVCISLVIAAACTPAIMFALMVEGWLGSIIVSRRFVSLATMIEEPPESWPLGTAMTGAGVVIGIGVIILVGGYYLAPALLPAFSAPFLVLGVFTMLGIVTARVVHLRFDDAALCGGGWAALILCFSTPVGNYAAIIPYVGYVGLAVAIVVVTRRLTDRHNDASDDSPST